MATRKNTKFGIVDTKGFTLVELLIVLTVIAILVAILLPSLRFVTRDAKIARVQGDLKNLEAAIVKYVEFYQAYPYYIGATTPNYEHLVVLTYAEPVARVITTLPKDPFNKTKNTYYFNYFDNGAWAIDKVTYVIGSVSPDGLIDLGTANDTVQDGGNTNDDYAVSNARLPYTP